jgi:hypothetical protein
MRAPPRRASLLLTALPLAALGCIHLRVYEFSRGTLAVVSSRPFPKVAASVYYPRVEGRACYGPLETGKGGIELAVRDALAMRPAADALTLVTLHVENQCFVVEGTPVRLK